MKKFVFIHRPPAEIEKWAYHSMPYRMSRPFTKLMSQYKVDHVFCGHIHAYSTATYQGIPYTIGAHYISTLVKKVLLFTM